MGRKLIANVYVGETLYRVGEEPPKEIADQITNPAAWYEKGDPQREESTDDTPVSDQTLTGPPPKAGKGSGLEAWQAYARSQGVDVPDDATRDDIIDLVG